MEYMDKYYQSVETHRRLVWQVGRVLNLDEHVLVKHDLSKYSVEEFIPYAIWYWGIDEDKQCKHTYSDYMLAWQHHINHNPHHWQHWILDTISPESKDGIDENKAVSMPLNFVLEMVVDWQAAGIQYQQRYDMSKWLSKNFDDMVLHDDTRKNIIKVLEELGYSVYKIRNETDFILSKAREDIQEIINQVIKF